jgi:hypothetical protein
MGCSGSTVAQSAEQTALGAQTSGELSQKHTLSGAHIALIVIATILIGTIIVLLVVQAVKSNKDKKSDRENSVIYLNSDCPIINQPSDKMHTQLRKPASRQDMQQHAPHPRAAGPPGGREMLRSPPQYHRRSQHASHAQHQSHAPHPQHAQHPHLASHAQHGQHAAARVDYNNGGAAESYGAGGAPSGMDPYPQYQYQYQAPVYDVPAPMPQAQLMQAPGMATEEMYLPGAPSSSNIIGDAQMDIMTTENQGTSIDGFSDSSYLMDPGMMTPGSPTDIQGLQSFMPYMGGGIGGDDQSQGGEIGGPVDPNTGLPLFTTGKLIRSQLLGGHGAGSFLRQVQDPLTGYKKTVGKNLCGVQQTRRDLEVRRQQLNAARLEHPDADPILFNSSEFAYN